MTKKKDAVRKNNGKHWQKKILAILLAMSLSLSGVSVSAEQSVSSGDAGTKAELSGSGDAQEINKEVSSGDAAGMETEQPDSDDRQEINTEEPDGGQTDGAESTPLPEEPADGTQQGGEAESTPLPGEPADGTEQSGEAESMPLPEEPADGTEQGGEAESTPLPGEPAGGTELPAEEGVYEDIAELEEIPEDEVGAAVWADAANFLSGIKKAMRFFARRSYDWNFDLYYVNQDDRYDVTKTEDFNLKYQMQFHTNRPLEAGDVEIRIPRSLLSDRKGNSVNPGDIAVPLAEDRNQPVASGTPFNYYIEKTENGTEYLVFFNYRDIDAGTNVAWQVLYKNVKLMQIEDLTPWNLEAEAKVRPLREDGTVSGSDAGADEGIEYETQSPDPLTGLVDSRAGLTGVSKVSYSESGRNYTPGLYTQNQIEQYIIGGLPQKYQDNFDSYVFAVWEIKVSGTANQPWRLSVSDTPYIKSSDPAAERIKGEVVGFKKNLSSTYFHDVNFPEAGAFHKDSEGNDVSSTYDKEIQIVNYSEEESWRTRFYVVTAYPKAEVQSGITSLENEIHVSVDPVDDGEDRPNRDKRTASAKWTYVDYNWTYSGQMMRVEKKSDETVYDEKQYTGWLEMYNKASADGKGYGGIPFHTEAVFRSYLLTHGTDKNVPSEFGRYRLGTASEITTVDDIMYAHVNTQGVDLTGLGASNGTVMLKKGDYYYTGVKITQTDIGYDVWEDAPSEKPESLDKYYEINAGTGNVIWLTDGSGNLVAKDTAEAQEKMDGRTAYLNQNVYVYAMYETAAPAGQDQPALGADGQDPDMQAQLQNQKWEYVCCIPWNESGVMTHTFSEEELARKPYRIMAVHKTINYASTCNIDVEVCFNASTAESPTTLGKIITAYEDYKAVKEAAGEEAGVLSVKIEDLSGILGAGYADGKRRNMGSDHGEGSADGEGSDGDIVTNQGAYYQYQDDGSEKDNYNAELYKDESGRNDLTVETEKLYIGGAHPARDNASKVVTGLQTEAHAYKRVTTRNDAANSRVILDYYLTAYDGYQIYSQEGMDYLIANGQTISPGRNNVVFYDLLPYGVHFEGPDSVKAGRIRDFDSKKNYTNTPTLWSYSQVSVQEVEVTENWRGTGRTMLAFHIKYDGKDSTIYSNKLWAEAWGVTFSASYDWMDQQVVREGANVAAFMPDAKYPDEGYALKDEDKGADGKPTEAFLFRNSLRGTSAQVAKDNGVLTDIILNSIGVKAVDEADYRALITPDPENGEGGIDGNSVNYDIPNVLYAGNADYEDVSSASLSGILKRVSADSDHGKPGESAAVKAGEGYTYDLSVSQTDGTLTNIVVLDFLETAHLDPNNAGKGYRFDGAGWQGHFKSVDTNALEMMGVKPQVYYYMQEDSGSGDNGNTAKPLAGVDLKNLYAGTEQSGTPSGNLHEKEGVLLLADGDLWEQIGSVSDNVWKKAEDVSKDDYNKIKAVAVKMYDADGNAYVLKDNKTLSFRIRMTAPTEEELEGRTAGGNESKASGDATLKLGYAYNSPYYYAVLEKKDAAGVTEQKGETLQGNPVMTAISEYKSLTVGKALAGEVPAEMRNTSFQFRLYWIDHDLKGNEITKAVSQKEYTLEKLVDGVWVPQEGSHWTSRGSFVRTVDGKQVPSECGLLSLRADERAVFNSNLPSVESIQVEEVPAGICWDVSYEDVSVSVEEDGESEAGDIRSVTVTNTYRPILFVSKRLSGTPASFEDNGKEFIFKIMVKEPGAEEFVELTGKYYESDSYSATAKLKELGELGGGSLEEGCFVIKKDQIIALFPGKTGTKYKLQEITADGKPLAESDWICGEESGIKQGAIEGGETQASITNYYRYKDLYLTKEIQGQDAAECTQEFTFELYKVVNGQEELVREPLVWHLLDSSGNPVKAEAADPENGSDHTEKSALAVSGTLTEGRFTCAFAGKTVRIEGLELGIGESTATYVIKEVVSGVDYQPENDSVSVTIHYRNDKVSKTFVNKYLRRSLAVTKMVTYDFEKADETKRKEVAEREFTLKALVDGEPLAGCSYTVTVGEAEVGTGTTAADGTFKIKDGQTVTLKDAGRQGQVFWIRELQDVQYPQIYSAKNDTSDGMATELGLNKDSNYADEHGYGAPYVDSFGEETSRAMVINGEGKYLMVRKEYVGIPGGDSTAENDQDAESRVRDADGSTQNAAGSSRAARAINTAGGNGKQTDGVSFVETVIKENKEGFKVKFTLRLNKADGTKVSWPTEDKVLNALDDAGKISQVTWECAKTNSETGESEEAHISIEPWLTVLIPMDELNEAAGEGGWVSYELEESDDDKHQMLDAYTREGLVKVEISQQTPENDGALLGTSEDAMAVIRNQVEVFIPNFRVGKYMALGSNEVPEGAKLVWQLQKYESGGWVPASGVKYLSYTSSSADMVGMIGSMPGTLTTDHILTTDERGRIVLTKSESGYPFVAFDQSIPRVYLNLYRDEDIQNILNPTSDPNGRPSHQINRGVIYRLVELPEDEEYDVESWGLLAGYALNVRDVDSATEMENFDKDNILSQAGTSMLSNSSTAGSEATEGVVQAGVKATERMSSAKGMISNGNLSSSGGDKLPSIGDDMSWLKDAKGATDGWNPVLYAADIPYYVNAAGFVNSNRTDTIEIEKRMSTSPGKTFHMILEKVVGEEKGEDGAVQYVTDPAQAQGISYTICSAATGKPIAGASELVIGEDGAILLKPGQYAKLELPVQTRWIVSEREAGKGYDMTLTALQSSDSQRLVKLDNDRMLICPKDAKQDAYMLEVELKSNEMNGGVAVSKNLDGNIVWPEEEQIKEKYNVYLYSSEGRRLLADDEYHAGIIESTKQTYTNEWSGDLWWDATCEFSYPDKGLMKQVPMWGQVMEPTLSIVYTGSSIDLCYVEGEQFVNELRRFINSDSLSVTLNVAGNEQILSMKENGEDGYEVLYELAEYKESYYDWQGYLQDPEITIPIKYKGLEEQLTCRVRRPTLSMQLQGKPIIVRQMNADSNKCLLENKENSNLELSVSFPKGWGGEMIDGAEALGDGTHAVKISTDQIELKWHDSVNWVGCDVYYPGMKLRSNLYKDQLYVVGADRAVVLKEFDMDNGVLYFGEGDAIEQWERWDLRNLEKKYEEVYFEDGVEKWKVWDWKNSNGMVPRCLKMGLKDGDGAYLCIAMIEGIQKSQSVSAE